MKKSMVTLPVVAGYLYPCALTPTSEGEYLEVTQKEHGDLLDAWNTQLLAFSVNMETKELIAHERSAALTAKVLEALQEHPAHVSLTERIAEQTKAEADGNTNRIQKLAVEFTEKAKNKNAKKNNGVPS